jgi:putative salt-induced outer membrane protein YdiY
MTQPHRIASLVCAAVLLGAVTSFPAEIPGWYTTADLSFVMTEGNSKTSNFGATLNVSRKWLRTSWDTDGSFVRTEVAEPTRQAFVDGAGFVLETGPRVTKSERYFLNTDLKRRVTERFYWNVGGSGERDVFAGLNHRITGVGGVGYLWENQQDGTFSTGIAATYTGQDEVVDDPETENDFFGLRFTADGEKRFGETKQNAFTSNLVVDENMQDTEDLRFNWQNALAVAMSQRMALKFGVGLVFDNQPQLVEFPLFVRVGNTVTETGVQVPGRAEKLDIAATVSFVVNFAPGGPTSRPTQ